MVDKDLADEVRAAITHLNAVINTASNAGLCIEIEVVDRQEMRDGVPRPILIPQIMRKV